MFPSPDIDVLNEVRDVFFPVIWFDEGAEIDKTWTRKYKNMVQVPFLLVDIFTYTAISIGSIFLIITLISFCLTRGKSLEKS